MKIGSFISFCLVILFQVGFAQQRAYVDHSLEKDILTILVSDGKYEMIPYTENIVHTTFYPDGYPSENFSYASILQPHDLEINFIEEEKHLKLELPKMTVSITKDPFQINYYYKDTHLIKEDSGYFAENDYHNIHFRISEKEQFFGTGARALPMDRRGYKLELYNRAHYGYEKHSELMNYTLPVIISSKKYMVLFDNASKGFLDLDSKQTNSLKYGTVGGTLNYYVIAGDTWLDLVEHYTELTGRQPLPPRWAFGNFSSRFGYHSQEETINTVDMFFEDSIPVDAVVIDIYWFGPGIFDDMGNLDWYRDSFPNPDRMIQYFDRLGVKTVLVSEPFILTTSDKWDEAVEAGVLATDTSGSPYTYDFYFGNTGLIDVFKPEAVDWFWSFYKDFTEQGIEGWWGDLGEPEVHPGDIQHVNGTGDEVHNAYGHKWAQLIFEGYEKDFPDKRPFILMRAGYAGSQRYGLIPWTGDVNRTWGGLYHQPQIALQMGMQGIGYMHSDLGGFAGGEEMDNELYIRWLQYGVFQPVYRPHAQEHIPSEPVFQNDTTKAYAKKAIELRYQLLPYIYNLAFQNNRTGKPLMTPLFFNEPDNSELFAYVDAYMWGDAFLVAPVKEAEIKEQHVYLPEGSNWYDFYQGKKYTGGQEITVPLSIKNIPVFVKGGSFIPMVAPVMNTKSYSLTDFEVHYYHDDEVRKSSYNLYNDDGQTPYAFEKSNYEFIKMEAIAEEGNHVFHFTLEQGSQWKGEKDKSFQFYVHNLNTLPSVILLNGDALDSEFWSYDVTRKVLSVPILKFTKQSELKLLYR